VAWQRYGNGKVLFIGTDRLFRLREGVGDKYHARFWGQAVQFLALSRLRGDDERITFEVTGVGAAEEPVSVYASALNEIWEPLSAPRLMARVRKADAEQGELVSLNPVPGIEGMFHGSYVPDATGVYEVTAAQAEEGAANTVTFEVAASSAEKTRVAMDQELLSRMAGLSGGRYCHVRELPVLLNDLTAPTQRIRIPREREIFDHWLWLLPLVGLLAAEWTWRRRKDLA
jgi:hypothetical protein